MTTEDLTKSRKLYMDANAAIASLTLKRLAHKAEGVRIENALARALADSELALSAIEAAEQAATAPAPAPEAIERHFQNGRPIDEDHSQA